MKKKSTSRTGAAVEVSFWPSRWQGEEETDLASPSGTARSLLGEIRRLGRLLLRRGVRLRGKLAVGIGSRKSAHVAVEFVNCMRFFLYALRGCVPVP